MTSTGTHVCLSDVEDGAETRARKQLRASSGCAVHGSCQRNRAATRHYLVKKTICDMLNHRVSLAPAQQAPADDSRLKTDPLNRTRIDRVLVWTAGKAASPADPADRSSAMCCSTTMLLAPARNADCSCLLVDTLSACCAAHWTQKCTKRAMTALRKAMIQRSMPRGR